MNKKTHNCVIFFAITAGILVVVAGAVLGVMWLSNRGQSPVVSIILPAENVTLNSGQGVALFVAAQASGGIDHIDFFVNDQLENTAPAPGEGDVEMDTAFPWLSSAIGIHKLSVIAYDRSGRASPTDDLMVAVLALPVGPDDSDYAFQLDHPSQILPEGSGVPEDQAGEESDEVGIAGAFPPFEGNPDEGLPFGQQVPRDELDEISDLLDNSRPEDDFPQEFDDSLSDEPPTIQLQIDVQRGESAHIVNYTTVAQDDLGVMETLVWYVRPGRPEITLQHDCMGELTCSWSGEIELDASVQQHGISAAAVDISGQMSEVAIEQIQLLDNENDLFAGLAIEPLDGHVPQVLANPFINDPGEMAQQGLFPGDFIDPDALAELDLDQDEPAEVEDDGCLMLYAQQSPEGIRLKAVVLCDIRASDSNELHFEFERLATVSQQQVIQPLDSTAVIWDQMMERQSLAPGDFFTYVDTLQACWTTYTYRVGLSDQAAGTQENGLFDPNLTSTELILTTQACSGDVFVEGIILNVESVEDGNLVSWQITNLESWYSGRSPDSIRLDIESFNEGDRISRNLRSIILSQATSSGEFLHPFRWCGEPLTYRLTLSDVQAGQILTVVIKHAYGETCEDYRLRNWFFDVSQFYEEQPSGHIMLMTRIQVQSPPGWGYPEVYDLLVIDVDPDHDHPIYSQVTDAIRRLGGHDDVTGEVMECGVNFPYNFQLELTVDATDEIHLGYWRGPTYDRGRGLWIWSEPCLPPQPAKIRLHATMCDGEPCVKVLWENLGSPGGLRYYPADNITLLRTVHGEDVVGQSVIELAPDQTSYIDTHVRPGARYSYRIFSSYQGIHTPGNKVAIVTPSGSEWDCLLIAPDYRCD